MTKALTKSKKGIIRFRAWDKVDKEIISWEDLLESPMYLLNDFPSRIFMQFTGLHDKNGKEIYEGDILKQYNQRRNTIVEFIDDGTEGRHFCGYRIHRPEEKIVIGNIYQNPNETQTN